MKSGDSKDVLSALAGSGTDAITTRPVIMGTNGMVTSGHYLASRIGLSVLEDGGNAVDAGVAMGFALAVLEPYIYGIGGEVPILIYLAKEKRVLALSGQGHAPRNSSIEIFRNMGIDTIPGDGLLAACVPDAVSTWITALSHLGTMDLARVLTPSWDLARNGFPMYGRLRDAIEASSQQFVKDWPTSAKAYMPEGRVPEVGEIWIQPDLAGMFRMLLDAESKNRNKGRKESLEAAREVFYKGAIAERIISFVQKTSWPDSTGEMHSGFLSAEDLLGYNTRLEDPVTVNYR
ncbi:MAG: gamma-glutamyltransferase, partial [Pseudomonadota bacterium]